MQRTVILGNGGHAKVVVEILREAGLYQPVGSVAPEPPLEDRIGGLPYLGPDARLKDIYDSGVRWAFVALGDNLLREALLQHVTEIGFHVATAVSRAAAISPSAHLGRGIAVMPGAVIGPDTRVGHGCIINTKASIDHDGILGTCCHLGPGATLAGNVRVGDHAFIATGSSVIPEIEIGSHSIIGAGSVVVRDIPSHVVAYGIPAEVQRRFGSTTSELSDESSQDQPPTFRLVS